MIASVFLLLWVVTWTECQWYSCFFCKASTGLVFFPHGCTVYLGQGSFLCLKCLDKFAKLHSNLRDNNRRSKVFLTGRLVSLVLVTQTVIFTVFISVAGLMLYHCYYNNSCTKIGHLAILYPRRQRLGTDVLILI